MVRAGAAILMLSALLAVVSLLSVTRALKLKLRAAVGIPVTIQEGLSVNPSGSAPEATVQVLPPDPPVAVSACEYATPTIPSGSEAVEITSGAGLTWMPSACVAVALAASMSLAVNVARPGEAGRPEILPLGASSCRLAGSDPAEIDQEYG